MVFLWRVLIMDLSGDRSCAQILQWRFIIINFKQVQIVMKFVSFQLPFMRVCFVIVCQTSIQVSSAYEYLSTTSSKLRSAMHKTLT